LSTMDDAITSTILESMSDGVVVFDLKGHPVFVNEAGFVLLGLEKKGIRDKTYVELFMGDQENDPFNDILFAGLQNREIHVYREVPFRRPDGKLIELAVTTSFLMTPSQPEGNGGGIVMVFKDITESKALDRARRRVIDHLSHELKTPLAVAGATLKRLAGQENDVFVRRIDQNLKRLKEIQQEVEDIVRQDAGRKPSGFPAMEQILMFLEMVAEEHRECAEPIKYLKKEIEALFPERAVTCEAMVVEEHVSAIVADARQRAGDRRVSLVVDAAETFHIRMDSSAFRKALFALLKNAVEATPDGGRVTVSVVSRGSRVEVSVKDTGIGITEESRKEIFGGFYHARETDLYSTKRPFDFGAGGKGLDLLRVKILSRACNFDIECESRRCRFLPGEGRLCPGSIESCSHVANPEECAAAGGTTFRLLFGRMAPEGSAPA
jgi:PAS domain S-box-containing protein